MKKIIIQLLICFSFFMLQNLYAAEADLSPVGYWKTIDDVSGNPKSILQLWLTDPPNQTLSGRIVKIYPDPGKDEKELCERCEGAKHNQPILGMIIMEHLVQNKDNPEEWAGGEILDPRSGKIYHIKLKLIENGQKLNARGYIGLPLFGRTQTWIRVPGPEG